MARHVRTIHNRGRQYVTIYEEGFKQKVITRQTPVPFQLETMQKGQDGSYHFEPHRKQIPGMRNRK